MRRVKKSAGFGVIEVLIASGIIAVTIFSLYYVFVLGTRLSSDAGNKISANFLAEEGLEAARFLRDAGWQANISVLAPGTNYYISFDKNISDWRIISSATAPIDNTFYRTLTVENVFRDSGDNIVSSGGTLDPDTKKINVQVLWQRKGAASTVLLSTYLTDIFDN